jgi:gliding motility-associated-like protein
MKYVIALILINVWISFAFGQYEDRYWVLGRTNSPTNTTNISFDFYPNGLALYNTNGAPPAINPPPVNISSANGFEGWGVVTNPETGDLLFYTDGNSVYDNNHQDITPAGGLGASPSSAQAVAISVVPVCPFNQYYIFSNPAGVSGGNSTNGPVTYRIYTLGGGFSPILPLPGPNGNLNVGEGMLIIPSKTDPFTYWLIVRLLTPSPNVSDYVVYQINESGISFLATFGFGPPITGTPYSPIMNMTYVDDGSAANVIVGFSVSGSPNRVFTNTFNTTTGFFTGTANIVTSLSGGTLYDLEFSPGGNYIYYATYFPSALYQVPINGGAAVQLRNFGNLRGGGLKRAPDGFIYHTYDAGAISNNGMVRIGRIVQAETAFDGSNFDEIYHADFNSTVSMIYEDVFAYNFPEFANVPNWEANVFVEGNNPICPGSSTVITAVVNSLGQNVESFTWTLNGNPLAVTTEPSIEVDQEGIYQVEILLEGGCTFLSNLISIVLAAIPQFDELSVQGTACGETDGVITIDASGGTGLLMYALNDNDFQSGNSFSNLTAGIYQVSIQDENACIITQEVEVPQLGNVPEIMLVSTTEASCLGNDGSLTITASGGMGILLYSINGGDDFQFEPTFVELTAGTYTIVVVDVIGCRTTTSVVLPEWNDGPLIETVEPVSASCSDDDGMISVVASGVNAPLRYSLDGINFQSENHFPGLASGLYTIVVEDEKGCFSNQNVEVLLEEDLPVIENLVITPAPCNTVNGQISVQASGGTGDLQFSINGNSFQTENTFSMLSPGNYLLAILDELGCSVDTTFTIVEGRCPVYIPNVFSPNDDGINDRFQVYSNGNPATFIKKYTIFDRWGELIFESKDFLLEDRFKFWDGNFKGRKMGTGVYVYLIEIVYSDGFSEVLKGDITLLK